MRNITRSLSDNWYLTYIPDVNKEFLQEYLNENQERALTYLNSTNIDINYQEGLFLTKAAEAGDLKMIKTLLKRGATEGLTDALRAAASEGHEECVELLIDKGAKPELLRGSTAYDNYPHIKDLLDQKIAEAKVSARFLGREIQTFLMRRALLKSAPLPAMKNLTLGISKDFINESQVNTLIASLPNINMLSISLYKSATESQLEALLVGVKKLSCLTDLRLWARGDRNSKRCEISSLPLALWQLTQLQRLTLNKLDNLSILPLEISQLQELQTLKLIELKSLRTLPLEIGQLTQLQKLTLNKLDNLSILPSEISQLQELQTLRLIELKNLGTLPLEIGQLTQLQKLTLNKLDNLSTLPSEISQLQELQTLKLIKLKSLSTLPLEIGQLTKLQALELDEHITIPDDTVPLKIVKKVSLE